MLSINFSSKSKQFAFSPIDYCFEWADDWYLWDRATAIRRALDSRNEQAKLLRSEGWTVKKWSLPDQLIRKGGIGSGHPDVEFVVTVYMINAQR